MQYIKLLPDSMHNATTVAMCTFPVLIQTKFSAPTGYYKLGGCIPSPSFSHAALHTLLYFQELRPAVEVQDAIREDTSLKAGTASKNS